MKATIRTDFSKITGKIKMMHAINNPPVTPYDRWDSMKYYRDARIPYARLHDTGGAFGGSHYVDIPNIFPNFDADENLPESYDFAFTDEVIKNLVNNGVEPFYRLGCTIENNCQLRAYAIYPPKDPNKWARICEHVIRHYTEGWADGFNFKITYWEIWNEPDNEPDMMKNPMWRGTPEQYFELYDVTSKHLKALFPHLKIGGYASCGFYAIDEMDVSAMAHSTTRTGWFIEFFKAFFTYIQEHQCPLDFFSWHSYAGIQSNVRYAAFCRDEMRKYGFGNAEMIFDEWNVCYSNRGKLCDAGDTFAMMSALQNSEIDMAMYYDGQVHSGYCGIFDPISHGVFPAYYAFLWWGQLYTLGNHVQVECDEPKAIYSTAATDGTKKLIVIANVKAENVEITAENIPQNAAVEYFIDGNKEPQNTLFRNGFILPAGSIAKIEF